MTSLPPQQARGPQTKRKWLRRSTVALPLLCLLIFGTIIGVRLAGNANDASAAGLAPIKGQVPGLVKTSALVGATDTNQKLALSVGLQMRNVNNLKAYVDSMSRPKSLTSHKHLTQAQISAAYAPLEASQQAVINYMQGYGFALTKTNKLHLAIGFQGTVGEAENAFHIQINNYRSSKGLTFFAPSSNPTLPNNLANLIQNVAGLDNAVHFSHPPIGKKPGSAAAHALTANSNTCPAGNTNYPGYFVPSQIATAYNLQGFYNNGFRGEGQKVALFELDNYQQSDINVYTSCYGGGQVPISTTAVDGGPGNASDAASEVELDMELILSAAPHLAGLNVYEGPNWKNATDIQVQDLWTQIVTNDSESVISTSWGGCETSNSLANLQYENTHIFMIAAAQGQTVLAASGDNGTNDCLSSFNPNAHSLAVDDPASQPYVTGVGGTTLALGNNNSYQSETTWNEENNITYGNYGAGGGGVSNIWPMPSWQQGPGVNNSYTSSAPCGAPSGTNCREVPDVSLNADPLTGYVVYCTVKNGQGCLRSGWLVFGGTSTAAPMWAAFIALANEKSLHDGGFDIGFINPYLYQIDQSAGGTSYNNDFHDITIGNNDGLNDGGNTYPATANYDMATGLGSFNAWNLANDLEKLVNAQNGSRSAPANTTWYFAEGSVGGGFQEFITIMNPGLTTAHVNVEYLFQSAPAQNFPHTIAASSRGTVVVNGDLGVAVSAPQQAISVIVTSDVPVVAERPMYFNYDGVNSGTDVVGGTNLTHKTFYFAQGDASLSSADTSHEFISILNPDATQTASVTATFYSGGHEVEQDTISVPPLQRNTIVPTYHGQAAIQVTSTIGVVVERPTYVTANIPNAGGRTTGASSAIGATSLGNDWLFAEGFTGPGFQEYLVLANFTPTATTATVKLEYSAGSGTQTVQVPVAGQSQVYFDVNNANAHPVSGCGCSPTGNVSAEVSSPTASIVAERVMYFHYLGTVGESDVVGQAGPASQSVYSFAEGNATSTFQEFLTLQNPTANPVTVAVTLFVNQTVMEVEVNLPAYSRSDVNVNAVVSSMVNSYAPHDGEVSVVVQAFNGGTVVVERPMYFNYNMGGGYATTTGGTDVIGYTGN